MGKAALVAAAGFAVSGACADDWPFVLPGGVSLKPVTVYRNWVDDGNGGGDWADSDRSFPHGNASVRFVMENPSRLAQSVSLEMPLSVERESTGTGVTRLTALVDLPPESSKTVDIPVPYALYRRGYAFAERQPWVVRDSGGAAHRLPGHRLCDDFLPDYRRGSASPRFPMSCGPKAAPCAASGLLVAATPAARNVLVAGKKKPDGGKEHVISAPDFSLFRRWQELAVFDAVVLSADEYDALPAETGEMLLDYAAAGGSLVWAGERGYFGAYGFGEIFRWDGADAQAAWAAARLGRERLGATCACDDKAAELQAAARADTPFAAIILVLLAFTVLAGPVALFVLARCNRRIAVLWVFPAAAVLFSFAVAAVIVLRNGVTPRLHQFSQTLIDERAGRAVTVQNDIFVSPIPLISPIVYDAKDSLVSYSSGERSFGSAVVFSDGRFEFYGGWTPPLWPVSFRSVTVRDIALWSEEGERVSLPYAGRLGKRTVDASVERRAAK